MIWGTHYVHGPYQDTRLREQSWRQVRVITLPSAAPDGPFKAELQRLPTQKQSDGLSLRGLNEKGFKRISPRTHEEGTKHKYVVLGMRPSSPMA